MVIQRWTGPPVATHTYLLIDAPSREAWAVDAPLQTAETVMQSARDQGLRLTRLVLTHGHFDHILDVERYQAAGVPVAAHPKERTILAAPQTLLMGVPYRMPETRVAEELEEGNTLRLGETEWRVWHVPGHSPGHLILHCAAERTVIGGDLLFEGGYGRVDLPGSDPAQMTASLRRLLALPDDTRVYPGHGPETTVGSERSWLEALVEEEVAA